MSSLVLGASAPAGAANSDRWAMLSRAGCTFVAVADGAGNSAMGATAAHLAVALAVSWPLSDDPRALVSRLMELDARIGAEVPGGETTLVVVTVQKRSVTGAAVGDSVAWLIRSRSLLDLTEGTARKPLLGSGEIRPRSFGPIPLADATLVLATDGLWKYAPRHAIIASSDGDPDKLLDLARLPSGALQDDATAVVVRALASPPG